MTCVCVCTASDKCIFSILTPSAIPPPLKSAGPHLFLRLEQGLKIE